MTPFPPISSATDTVSKIDLSEAWEIAGVAASPKISGVTPKKNSSANLLSTGTSIRQFFNGISRLRWFRDLVTAKSGSFPATGCLIVCLVRIDPVAGAAVHAVLLLPEGRARLQVVHQKIR